MRNHLLFFTHFYNNQFCILCVLFFVSFLVLNVALLGMPMGRRCFDFFFDKHTRTSLLVGDIFVSGFLDCIIAGHGPC